MFIQTGLRGCRMNLLIFARLGVLALVALKRMEETSKKEGTYLIQTRNNTFR